MEGCYKVFLKSSLLQAEQLQLSQPFLIGEGFIMIRRVDSVLLEIFANL